MSATKKFGEYTPALEIVEGVDLTGLD